MRREPSSRSTRITKHFVYTQDDQGPQLLTKVKKRAILRGAAFNAFALAIVAGRGWGAITDEERRLLGDVCFDLLCVNGWVVMAGCGWDETEQNHDDTFIDIVYGHHAEAGRGSRQ